MKIVFWFYFLLIFTLKVDGCVCGGNAWDKKTLFSSIDSVSEYFYECAGPKILFFNLIRYDEESKSFSISSGRLGTILDRVMGEIRIRHGEIFNFGLIEVMGQGSLSKLDEAEYFGDVDWHSEIPVAFEFGRDPSRDSNRVQLRKKLTIDTFFDEAAGRLDEVLLSRNIPNFSFIKDMSGKPFESEEDEKTFRTAFEKYFDEIVGAFVDMMIERFDRYYSDGISPKFVELEDDRNMVKLVDEEPTVIFLSNDLIPSRYAKSLMIEMQRFADFQYCFVDDDNSGSSLIENLGVTELPAVVFVKKTYDWYNVFKFGERVIKNEVLGEGNELDRGCMIQRLGELSSTPSVDYIKDFVNEF